MSAVRRVQLNEQTQSRSSTSERFAFEFIRRKAL